MNEDLKHSTVKTYTKQPDGSTVIETESYHEGPVAYRKEITKSIKTSTGTLLSDVIACLDVLKGKGTPELSIVIQSNEYNLPTIIKKTYTLEKEVYNRKKR